MNTIKVYGICILALKNVTFKEEEKKKKYKKIPNLYGKPHLGSQSSMDSQLSPFIKAVMQSCKTQFFFNFFE